MMFFRKINLLVILFIIFGYVESACAQDAPASITNLVASIVEGGFDSEKLTAISATTSSSYSVDWNGAKTIDDNLSTGWCTPHQPVIQEEWVCLDLGQISDVSGVRLYPRPGYPHLFPDEFYIETSSDGASWTEAHHETGYTAQQGVWCERNFAVKSGRYVRLRCQGQNFLPEGYTVTFMEFEVYGLGDGEHIELSWTAVGADGTTGQASSYDVRWSASGPLTASNWSSAEQITPVSAPMPSGSQEVLGISLDGFPVNTTIYFGVRAIDDLGEYGEVGNSASIYITEITPASINDLSVVFHDNTATGKIIASSATASSVYSSDWNGDKTIDDNLGTGWCTPHQPVIQEEWLCQDLGGIYAVTSVRLYPRPGYPHLFPDDFYVEVSLDGVVWSVVHHETGYVAQQGVWYEKSVSPVNARYVRMRCQGQNHLPEGYTVTLMEFEVYGEASDYLTFSWTAVGDDGSVGQASSYDMRWSVGGPITESNWDSAVQVTGEPVPAVSGTIENMILVVDDLPRNTPIYFCVRAIDDLGAIGPIGNNCCITISAEIPGAINDLVATHGSGGVVSQKLNVQTVTASSIYSTDWNGEKVVDGNLGTGWCTPHQPVIQEEWLCLDMGESHWVNGVKLYPRYPYLNLFPDDFYIERSMDGVTWSEVHHETGYVAHFDEWYQKSFPGVMARYIRMRCQGQNHLPEGYTVTLMEFEVYGNDGKHHVDLSWTAVGSNGTLGQASEYDMRWSTAGPITEANWSAANQVSAEPLPAISGTSESMTVDGLGLPCNTTIYFALRAANGGGYWGPIGNNATVVITEVAPAAIDDLDVWVDDDYTYGKATVASATASSVYSVDWNASKVIDDDFDTGWCTPHQPTIQEEWLCLDLGEVCNVSGVRLYPRHDFPHLFPDDFYIEVSVDGSTWVEAHHETGYVAQADVWYEKNFSVQNGRYVRLRCQGQNHLPEGYTVTLMEFEVYAGWMSHHVDLSWTAVGDDGTTGQATSYDIRYSTSPITLANWDSASQVDSEPSPAVAGSAESMELDYTGLPTNTIIYYNARAIDELGVLGPVGNNAWFVISADPTSFLPIPQSTTVTGRQVTMSWLPIANADHYRYTIYEQGTSNVVYSATEVMPADCSATVVLDDGSYTWKVQAHDPVSNTYGSEAAGGNFSIAFTPAPVSTSVSVQEVNMAWTQISDSDSYSYIIYEAGTSNVVATGSVTGIGAIQALADGSYSWCVKAHDPYSGTYGSESVRSDFVVDFTPDHVSTTIAGDDVTLTWTQVSDAESYVYTIYEFGTTNVIATGNVSGSANCSVTESLSAGSYTWTVKAYDAEADSCGYESAGMNFSL